MTQKQPAGPLSSIFMEKLHDPLRRIAANMETDLPGEVIAVIAARIRDAGIPRDPDRAADVLWSAVADAVPMLDDDGRRALLAFLRAHVPTIAVTDGVESEERPALPREAPRIWRGAATLLATGELEYMVEGDPPDGEAVWAAIRAKVALLLHGVDDAPDASEGPTQAAHAARALAHLEAIEFSEAVTLSQATDDEERAWLRALVVEVAANAFMAGVEAQISARKPLEINAARDLKAQADRERGGAVRKGQLARQTIAAVEAMVERMARGETVTHAARHVARETGMKPDAVRKAWTRHRPSS